MSERLDKAIAALTDSTDMHGTARAQVADIALIQAQIALAEAVEELVALLRPLSLKAQVAKSPTGGW